MIKLARNDSSNRWVSVRKSIQNVFVPNSSAENCLLLCEWHIKWSHRRNPLLCCALDIPHMEVANNATARSTPILCPLKHLFIERWRFHFCSKSTGNVTQAPYCMCFFSWSNSRCTAFVMMGFICMHLSKNTTNVSYDYMGRGSLLLPSWSSITLYTKNKMKVLQKCIVKWMFFLIFFFMQLRLHILLHETNPISPVYAFPNVSVIFCLHMQQLSMIIIFTSLLASSCKRCYCRCAWWVLW